MENVEKIEEILSHNWSDVYDICDTVQEAIDYIYGNSDEQDVLEEEWNVFTDMVDDAFNYGFTTTAGKEYEPLEN